MLCLTWCASFVGVRSARSSAGSLAKPLAESAERLIGRRQRHCYVGVVHGRGHEPVVPRMDKCPPAPRFGRELADECVVAVTGEAQVGHRVGPGVADLES